MRAATLTLALATFMAIGFVLPTRSLAQDDFDDEFGDDFGDDSGGSSGDAAGSADDDFGDDAGDDFGDDSGDDFGDDSGDDFGGDFGDDAGGADGAGAAGAAGAAAAAGETHLRAPEELRNQRLRYHPTLGGVVGGVHVVDASPGAAESFRVGLTTDFFFAGDFLNIGDQNDHIGGYLTLSWTVHEMVEVYASIISYANANNTEVPDLFQVLGDTFLGVKFGYDLSSIFTIGGDLNLGFLNTVGDIGLVFGSTSVGIRANATLDLRGLEDPFPFISRFNLQYYFDNSANLISDVEEARYAALPDPRPIALEDRHLITRVERFALNINRTDFFKLGIGLESPLMVAEDFFINPIIEWNWWIPVNRQGYDCLFIPGSDGSDRPVEGQDGCLDKTGAGAFPMDLTLGVRVLPPVAGLGFLLGVDIGLSGATIENAVRELAQNRPYNVFLGMSYAYDVMEPPIPEPVIQEVERRVEVRVPPPPKGRINAVVVEQGTGTPIDGAIVRFPSMTLTVAAVGPAADETDEDETDVAEAGGDGSLAAAAPSEGAPGTDTDGADGAPAAASAADPGTEQGRYVALDLSPIVTAEDGRFTSYQFDPGVIQMEISHEGYNSGTCVATIADENTTDVEVRCELVALPRVGGVQGRVVGGEDNAAIAAAIQITGPEHRTINSDAAGAFTVGGLLPGTYHVQVDSEGYLIKNQTFEIAVREVTNIQIDLVERPRRPLVRVQRRQIRIRRQINFATNSNEILPTSFPLMNEIADVVIRTPELTRIEIQGHTDNRGGAAHNTELSQRRADSVRQWLIEHGIDEGRLEARGYGQAEPLVPNITPANRARNRRVQFMISERAEAPAEP